LKVQIINSGKRQFIIDTKGKGKEKDTFLIGINEVITLDIEPKLLKKITKELPEGAQINIKE